MYRIEVYESFRLNRDEYNRRRALGDEVVSSWEKCDQSTEQAEQVVRWFEDSRGLVAEDGASAQFAAAPELPVKPEEQPVDKTLVSTESPDAPEAATTPASESTPPIAPPAPTTEAPEASAAPAAPSAEPTAGPTLLNAVGKALVQAATEAAKPEAEKSESTTPADEKPAITPMPLERAAPQAKKSSKTSKKATKKSAQKTTKAKAAR
jgi:hypothetical protein